jgi:hypothetical protein
MPTIKPSFNRLLVKPVPSDHPAYGKKSVIVSPNGIVPEDIQSLIVEVIAIPENAIQYAVGDLLFPQPGSIRAAIQHQGEKYALINECEILGKLIQDETPNAPE